MSGVDGVAIRLEALSGLQAEQLRNEWKLLYGTSAPKRLSRDLLIRAIAFRIQEQAHGDGGKVLERRLKALSEGVVDTAELKSTLPGPGSRLIREWNGQTHAILVLDSGFEYRNQRYGSLTQIAKKITGAHWSGPRFFGLKRASVRNRPVTLDESDGHE